MPSGADLTDFVVMLFERGPTLVRREKIEKLGSQIDPFCKLGAGILPHYVSPGDFIFCVLAYIFCDQNITIKLLIERDKLKYAPSGFWACGISEKAERVS